MEYSSEIQVGDGRREFKTEEGSSVLERHVEFLRRLNNEEA